MIKVIAAAQEQDAIRHWHEGVPVGNGYYIRVIDLPKILKNLPAEYYTQPKSMNISKAIEITREIISQLYEVGNKKALRGERKILRKLLRQNIKRFFA